MTINPQSDDFASFWIGLPMIPGEFRIHHYTETKWGGADREAFHRNYSQPPTDTTIHYCGEELSLRRAQFNDIIMKLTYYKRRRTWLAKAADPIDLAIRAPSDGLVGYLPSYHICEGRLVAFSKPEDRLTGLYFLPVKGQTITGYKLSHGQLCGRILSIEDEIFDRGSKAMTVRATREAFRHYFRSVPEMTPLTIPRDEFRAHFGV